MKNISIFQEVPFIFQTVD